MSDKNNYVYNIKVMNNKIENQAPVILNNKKEIKTLLRTRYLEYTGYKNKKIKSLRRKRELTGIVFSFAPILIMTLFVFGAAIVAMLYLSNKGILTADNSGVKESTFAKNWAKLSQDPLLTAAIKNTLILTAASVGITLFGGLLITSLLNVGKKVLGKKFFLIGFFFPQITSAVGSTIVFYNLFGDIFNTMENPSNSLLIVILATVWIQLSSTIVNFNVAFANIGKTEYEAASLDGAKGWQTFWKITLPLLAPIIAYQLIMTITFSMTAFGQSYIMITQGYETHTESVITWTVLGFTRVMGGVPGEVTNVGLGLLELTILAAGIAVLVVIANIIQPIKGAK